MNIRDGMSKKDTKIGKGTGDDSAKLRLHKEELDITKSVVQKGDVEISKEIIEERKIVDVPVAHEEVVIERRTINNQRSGSAITSEETIRIPVCEERLDVKKRTVVTGEVTARKRIVEDNAHIDEMLRHEESRVNAVGNPNIIESNK